jgi:hypothetical protein
MCGAAKAYLLVFTAAGWAAEASAAPVVQANSLAELAVRVAAGGGESRNAAWPAAGHSIAE